MPPIEGHLSLEQTVKLLRRWLVNGPPNSGKTFSWYTLPGKAIQAITYPRELGHITMPWATKAGVPIKHYYWELDVAQEIDWKRLATEVEVVTREILLGKKGPCDTFVGDGLHKLYSVMFMAECEGHPELVDEKLVGRKYGNTHERFWKYIDMVLACGIPYVAMSCWDGADKDNVLDKSKEATRHMYPDLPGQAAKQIMGKFSVVFSARTIGTGDAQMFRFQTRAGGDTRGAGVKVPPHVKDAVKKILDYELEQDWSAFDTKMVKAVTEAWTITQGVLA